MRKTILSVLILSLAAPVFTAAASAGGRTDKAAESGFSLRKHEFAIGGSFLPGYFLIPTFYGGRDYHYSEDTFVHTNAWWASYAYNFTKVFALGVSLTYEGVYEEWTAGCILGDDWYHFITPMVTARFSWLNRRLIRLYSSAGAGLLFCRKNESFHYCCFAFQATPIGISVGKRLYGYAELGLGTQYVIGCAGIGYRF